VASGAQTSEKTIESMDEFNADVNSYAAANPDGKLLVVFDIDDTLLESEHFFGGDSWYNWSRGNPSKDADGKPLVIADADKIQCIFDKLGVFYEMSRHRATEHNVPEIVSSLQSRFSVIALTSRSPDYRGATERELEVAGIHFRNSHLLNSVQALSYSLNDSKGRSRALSFQNGIVMSSGLNKGVVLEDLLKQKLNRMDVYDAIFFVDDGRKNIDRMNEHWKNKSIPVFSYLYAGVDKRIEEKDIHQARESRKRLNDFLEVAFPSRFKEFSDGNCNPRI
jgi:hypothetical protein